LGLIEKDFKTELFNQKSWEAEIWFGENEPQYLRHNLYEEEVAKTSLLIPEPFLRTIKDLSIKVERFYEGLNLFKPPKGMFPKNDKLQPLQIIKMNSKNILMYIFNIL